MTFPTPSGPIVSTFGAVTTHTVSVDPNLAAGDLLLINFSCNGGMTDPAIAPTVSDDVSILLRGYSSALQGMVLAKVSTGDEGGEITVTTDSAVKGVAHAYRVPAAEWYGSFGGIELSSTSGTFSYINFPALNTTWAADDNLYFILLQAADDGELVSSWPTGYATNGVDDRSGTTDNENTMVASSWRQLASDSEDPVLLQLTGSEQYVGVTLVVRPLVAGAATVTVPLGELTLTGAAPSTASGTTANVPLGELFLTGVAPTLSGATITVPAAQLFALTGNVPEVNTGASATASAGALSLTGNPAFIDTTILWPATEDLRADAWAPASNLPLVLLKIDHEDLSTPILVVNNKANVTSNGDEYTAFPFEILLPDNQEGSPPQARLRISNVSREIGQAVRSIGTPATVDLYVVRQETPDTIELQFEDMRLTNVRYDALVVEGTLEFENLAREAYPAYSFNPADFPGLIP